jgi:hypothetical protein
MSSEIFAAMIVQIPVLRVVIPYSLIDGHLVQVEVKFQSASPSGCRAPSRTHDQIFFLLLVLTIADFLIRGALSVERMDL